MPWNVFVDLTRRLSDVERRAVFDAVDAVVPDSGCVGPNRAGMDEVFFVVVADDEAAARARAAVLIARVFARAAITADYEITVQPRSGATHAKAAPHRRT